MSISSAALMYLASADKPSSEGFASYSKTLKLEAGDEQIYALAARFAKFLLSGKAVENGIGPDDVDPEELAMGIKVEAEHAGGDKEIAKRIALDHFAEFPSGYYKALKFMEDMLKNMEKEAALLND